MKIELDLTIDCLSVLTDVLNCVLDRNEYNDETNAELEVFLEQINSRY